MNQYLSLIGILLLGVSPVLIPTAVTVVHALRPRPSARTANERGRPTATSRELFQSRLSGSGRRPRHSGEG